MIMSMATPPKHPSQDLAAITAEMVDVAEALTRLLTQETELVRALRVKEIGALQGEKTRLTAAYQKAFKALTKANEGKTLPPSFKETLASAGQRLAAAVAENEVTLRAGKVATERLIGSIVTAVRDQLKNTTAYSPQQAPPRHGFMTAAAVDRRL
jgi:hypothetical protein